MEYIKKPIFWIIVAIVILAIYFAFFNASTKIFAVGGGTGPVAPAPGGGGGRGRGVVIGGGMPYVYPSTPGACNLPAACEAWIHAPSNNPNNNQLLDECIKAMKRLA